MRFKRVLIALCLGPSACGQSGADAGAEAQNFVGRHGAKIGVARISRIRDIPADPPADGAYRVHVIDVGSGLSVLIQGHDWNVLYDGGSTDDGRGITGSGNQSRLLSYLFRAIGPSGPERCVPDGDNYDVTDSPERAIDHLFLSHPHEDHASMLDEVLECYRVRQVWDSGATNQVLTYAEFLQAVAAEESVRYNTASPVDKDGKKKVFAKKIVFPAGFDAHTFSAGNRRKLDSSAKMKILHADGVFYANRFNLNSTVVRMDLGAASLLLTGDAQAGDRGDVDAATAFTEGYLIERFADDLSADILQVPHHGSLTSARNAFLEAISAKLAFVSAGPRPFHGITLPEQGALDAVVASGARLFRTDVHDERGCPEDDRVGVDDDRAGGCDNYIFEIEAP